LPQPLRHARQAADARYSRNYYDLEAKVRPGGRPGAARQPPSTSFTIAMGRLVPPVLQPRLLKRVLEVVERRGYEAYGAVNATIRLAAQSRFRI
jgi:hypothetical protein